MKRLIQLQPHPFRLLLHLEWILLGITFVFQFHSIFDPHPRHHHPISSEHLLLLFLSITSFGIMGLRLPMVNQFSKLIYIGLGFGLILLASIRLSFLPPLLLILVIRSCLIFKLTGRLIVSSLVSVFFLFGLQQIPERHSPHQPPPYQSLHRHLEQPQTEEQLRAFFWILKLNTTLLFGLVLLFVLLLVNALLAERQSREKLAIAHQQLHQYALRIEDQATLQERNRIAREIHDALGHSLTAQSIQLENALVFLPSNIDKTRTFLQEARQLNANALREVRQSVATLRSNPIQGQSLESALKLLFANFQHHTGIIPDYKLNLTQPLSTEISTTIYRIIQEALTNISKHGDATQVKIDLQLVINELHLRIEDNGKGFNPNQNTTGFGLQGMRERTLMLGGKFHVVSAPGSGCLITAVFALLRLA
ncbi:MAG: sensor histidine kinase [Rhizonema sp. PD37]|nr:sensor histidine kinase [Rhizonema sp. PD37]